MIIGAPKSVDDLPPLRLDDCNQVIEAVESMLREGVPLEVPLGVGLAAVGALARMARIGIMAEKAKAEAEATAVIVNQEQRPELGDLMSRFAPPPADDSGK